MRKRVCPLQLPGLLDHGAAHATAVSEEVRQPRAFAVLQLKLLPHLLPEIDRDKDCHNVQNNQYPGIGHNVEHNKYDRCGVSQESSHSHVVRPTAAQAKARRQRENWILKAREETVCKHPVFEISLSTWRPILRLPRSSLDDEEQIGDAGVDGRHNQGESDNLQGSDGVVPLQVRRLPCASQTCCNKRFGGRRPRLVTRALRQQGVHPSLEGARPLPLGCHELRVVKGCPKQLALKVDHTLYCGLFGCRYA
mmetsp:Transcript_1088/g.2441  ORF Transcript_1088/g.2441 Transcript_1088/m.2441 type:complete len:251 (-) Transcript_1088:108-860(-)